LDIARHIMVEQPPKSNG